MCSPRTNTSPASPGAHVAPALSTILTSVWKNALPVDSGLIKDPFASIKQAGPQVSVRP
jgi:hypothetical protein